MDTESSVEPPSTTTISSGGRVCPTIDCNASARNRAPFSTGTHALTPSAAIPTWSHDDRAARQVEPGNRADHDRGGRLDRCVAERSERCPGHLLLGPGAVAHGGDRRVGGEATVDQSLRDSAPLGDTHEHDDRAAHERQRFPVGLVLVAEPAVARDDRDARRHPPLGDRQHPRPAGAAIADVMPGTTSNGTPAACSSECLFAATTEEERVAALQPHHAPMPLRELDEQVVDELLGHRAAGSLAHVDALDMRGHERKRLGVRERVVHDHIRRSQEASGPHRQQLRITRTSTHEMHRADGRRLTDELVDARRRVEPLGGTRRASCRARRSSAICAATSAKPTGSASRTRSRTTRRTQGSDPR